MKNTTKYHMLTLLELIITLGIVAALASLFLDNMADTKARACEDHTIQKGEQLQAAVTGGEAGGFGEFLSDMGRWPRVYIPAAADGGDEGTDHSIRGGRRLAELYDATVWHHDGKGSTLESALAHEETISSEDIQKILNQPANDTFPVHGAAGAVKLFYPQVTMSVGWRGPYVNLSRPLGAKYFDGWGRSWKIVTNYNMKPDGTAKRLVENLADSDVKDSFGAGDECRIDGVVSYGADGAKDVAGAEVPPSDGDRKFIFAHPMDVFQKDRLASLNIRLYIRGEKGEWQPAADVRSWKSNETYFYRKGSMVTYGTGSGDRLYVCRTAHAQNSGAGWSAGNWLDLTGAAIQEEGSAFDASAPVNTLRISKGWVWRKMNGATDTVSEVNGTNWEKLFLANSAADSISILLFVPVMKETSGKRHMKLGQYHFFANAAAENKLGVVPQFGTSGAAGTDDVDAEDDTASGNLDKDYSVSGAQYNHGYNPRYLVAETVWRSWNELQADRLVPGRRKIFCAFYNSKTKIYQTSEVQWLELKPGDNFIELYLERKN